MPSSDTSQLSARSPWATSALSMCIRPLKTFEAIWNCSTWLICAGSSVTISPTPDQPQFSVPPPWDAAIARRPMPGRHLGHGQAASGGQQAQRGAAGHFRAAHFIAGQTEKRVLRVKVIGLFKFGLRAFDLVIVGHGFSSLFGFGGALVGWQNRLPDGSGLHLSVQRFRDGRCPSRSGIWCGIRTHWAGSADWAPRLPAPEPRARPRSAGRGWGRRRSGRGYRGAAGSRKRVSDVPVSMTCPRYITATRSTEMAHH